MPKFYLTLATCLLAATVSFAAPVSKEQARKQAAAFALQSGRRISTSADAAHKAPGLSGQDNTPFYIFDMANDGGFVIISGDDRTREIIGYTESGNYDENTIPDNMRSWLQMVADRISTLGDDSGSPAVSLARPQATQGVPTANVVIAPLLASTWNQGSPYWNQCPYRNGSRCYTGCTATAFAQVMYYHRYPTGATTSVPGYEDDGLYIDALGSTTFNWDAMYNSYGANDNANEEVAKLMRYIGQGALMHYTEGGSGAAFVHAINALKNYFGYPSDIYEIYKDNYSSQDWINALYSELYYGRPVLLEGYSDTNYGGGHAFVCDGYRDDGCFHINWGWGGWCDGYFSLDVLNPDDSSGMGAAQGSSGYYWHEGAVMNVRNPDGSHNGGGYTTTDRGVATFFQDANYGGYGYSLPEGSFTLSQMQAYGIKNDDVSSLKVLPGFKVTLYADDNFNGATAVYTSDASYVGNDWNDQASSIKIEPNGVGGKAGTYKIKNRNSGKFLDLDGNSTADNTAIVQWDDEGAEAYQQWTLVEVQSGVYSVQAAASGGKGFDVAYGSVDNATQVLLYPYEGGAHQQFILVDKGDGYYQFVARHCGKAVEIPSSSTNSGEWIKIWDNNGSYTQQWGLQTYQVEVPGAPDPDKASSKVKSVFSGKYSTQTPDLFTGDWGQATQSSVEYPGDNEALVWKNFNYLGLQFGANDKTIDVSDMEYLHLDFFPLTDTDINIYPISLNPTVDDKKSTQHLTAMKWNQVNIKLSDLAGVNLANVGQLKFDGGNGQTLYVDNIYFWTSKEDEPVTVPAAPTPDKDAAKVKAIYSNHYSDNNGGHYAQWWDGQATFAEEALASGDNAWHISNFVFIGIEHNSIDVSQMKSLHLDIYPVNVNAGLSIFVIAGGNEAYINVNATKGQWNQIDLSVADFQAKGIDLTKAEQIKITATDGANGQGTANFYLDNIYYWTDKDNTPTPDPAQIPAAPEPTQDASKVKSVFSGAYASQTPSLAVGSWGQATAAQNVYLEGNESYEWKNFNYLGLELGTKFDVSTMKNYHLDVYPLTDMTLSLTIISLDPTVDDKVVSKQLKANQWNQLDIALSQFNGVDLTKVEQLKFDGGEGQTLYLDNLYFWTDEDSGQEEQPVEITPAPAPDKETSKVKSLLSDQYADNNSAYYAQWWDGQAKMEETQLASGDKAWKISAFRFIGIEHGTIDVSKMEYLHLDVFPVATVSSGVPAAALPTLSVFPVTAGQDNTTLYKEVTLTANQWNQIDLPVADFIAMGLDMTRVAQLKLMGGNGDQADGSATFYLDNVYYWTSTATAIGAIGLNGGQPTAVYRLDGTLASPSATSTAGLKKGIYIVNGKKVVVR